MGAFEFTDGKNWSCGVVTQLFNVNEDPVNWTSLFVEEDLGKVPIFKKIPGGRRRNGDKDIWDTALRELAEETGVHITRDQLTLVDSQPRRDHVYHLFRATLRPEQHASRYAVGKNGEKVSSMTTKEMRDMVEDFLPHHQELLEKNNLWPK